MPEDRSRSGRDLERAKTEHHLRDELQDDDGEPKASAAVDLAERAPQPVLEVELFEEELKQHEAENEVDLWSSNGTSGPLTRL